MSSDILFDNFIITDNRDALDKWSSETWELKQQVELSSSGSAVSYQLLQNQLFTNFFDKQSLFCYFNSFVTESTLLCS